MRILRQLALIENYSWRKLYHVSADRFYLLLEGIPLDEAQAKAHQLRKALKGDYRIDARGNFPEDSSLELNDVTVHIGVSTYTYSKLQELLQRYLVARAVSIARAKIVDFIAEFTRLGTTERR